MTQRDFTIRVRVNQEERALLEKLAASSERTVSDTVRVLIRHAGEQKKEEGKPCH